MLFFWKLGLVYVITLRFVPVFYAESCPCETVGVESSQPPSQPAIAHSWIENDRCSIKYILQCLLQLGLVICVTDCVFVSRRRKRWRILRPQFLPYILHVYIHKTAWAEAIAIRVYAICTSVGCCCSPFLFLQTNFFFVHRLRRAERSTTA